jgi:hypothetical protein
MKRRSLLLSILCPGLGEFYCHETARALLLLFVRICTLAFPAAYLYDSSVDAKFFWAGSLALIAATHFYSVIYFAFRNSSEMDDLNLRYRGFPACTGFFFLHWILVLSAAVLFASALRVVQLSDDEGYPLYHAGEYVLVSARAPQQYHDGELVMTRTGGVARVICSDEGAVLDYSAGKILINDVAVNQSVKTADELRAAGITPDDDIYAEQFLGTFYLVAREKEEKSEKKKYVIGKNELMLCPDNRKDFEPSVVSRDLIAGKVEGKPPLVNESVRMMQKVKK